jgi:hypothetical protein
MVKERELMPRRVPVSEETRKKISNTVKKFWKENRDFMLEKQAGRKYKRDKIK